MKRLLKFNNLWAISFCFKIGHKNIIFCVSYASISLHVCEQSRSLALKLFKLLLIVGESHVIDQVIAGLKTRLRWKGRLSDGILPIKNLNYQNKSDCTFFFSKWQIYMWDSLLFYLFFSRKYPLFSLFVCLFVFVSLYRANYRSMRLSPQNISIQCV